MILSREVYIDAVIENYYEIVQEKNNRYIYSTTRCFKKKKQNRFLEVK